MADFDFGARNAEAEAFCWHEHHEAARQEQEGERVGKVLKLPSQAVRGNNYDRWKRRR